MGFFIILIGILLCFLPTLIAFLRKHPKRWWVLGANFVLLGVSSQGQAPDADLTERFATNPAPFILWFVVLGWSVNWFRGRPASTINSDSGGGTGRPP